MEPYYDVAVGVLLLMVVELIVVELMEALESWVVVVVVVVA